MLIPLLLLAGSISGPQEAPAVEAEDIRALTRVIGASFTDEEIRMMIQDVSANLASYERLRAIPLDNSVAPALYFIPDTSTSPGTPRRSTLVLPAPASAPTRPDDLEELAFADISTLRAHLDAGTVSCEELTAMCLGRLFRLDEKLHCVITLTEERALEQARALDEELERGELRGPLHGIPWVAKDLLAVKGYPTTWGAKPFEEQVLDTDATVVELLDAAGAVLIAKVSLGALAMGDVWYGERTRNPWDTSRGSSGSSAGPASAVAAGCAAFGIGSETLGSIVSPSHQCGNSSLRPTFGRVSRHGAMTLSWSMDKLGPLCRSAADAGIVFDVIRGADPRDPTTSTHAFDALAELDVEDWKVGYMKDAFDENEMFRSVLEELAALGVELVPIELPDYPVGDMRFVLSAEAAAAFDEFSRSDRDDLLVRQGAGAWPNTFRQASLIPAVDYLRANRLRTLLIRDLNAAIAGVKAIVHPSYAGGILTMTNLSGHPTFVAPAGFSEAGLPFSISFTGQLFGETELMTLVRGWQSITDYHLRHPEGL